jgi:hypothetical protein
VVTLATETTLQGPSAPTVRFRIPGGQLGRYRRIFVGAPQFDVDQRVVVFLGQRGSDMAHVLGLTQGVFRVAPASGVWVVTPPPIVASGALPRAIVRGDSSRQAMPLDEFERQVRVFAGAVR